MSCRRGLATRSFDDAVLEQLTPTGQLDGSLRATETNSYVAQGEYGRILMAFLQVIPAERIWTAGSELLASRPETVLDALLAFLGLEPGFRPPTLGGRFHQGGMRRLVDAERLWELEHYLDVHVWPHVADARVREGLAFFLETWNIARDEERPVMGDAARDALRAHYLRDAETLRRLGHEAGWLSRWQQSGDRAAAVV